MTSRLPLVRLLEAGQPTRTALRQAFGLQLPGLDRESFAWVVEHYPLQEQRRR